MIIKKTHSFCPECYKKIPAVIFLREGCVYIRKNCSEHGECESIIEKDAAFYLKCLNSNSGQIYNGYLLDVTQKCNIKCKYCYYQTTTGKDRSIESIIQEIITYQNIGPIIITGGEPTLRNDLPDIFSTAKQIGVTAALLTNGTKLDGKLIDELIPNMAFKNSYDSTSFINLSIHPESNGADMNVIDLMRERSIKLESVLFVIDDLSQVDAAIDLCHENMDVISSARLKLASKLWAEQKPDDSIFVSEVWDYIKARYDCEVAWDMSNKSRFFNIRVNGIHFMIVHWYDINNIDILDKSCPPYYKARNGVVDGINITALINEGMDKGYLDGVKI